MPDNFYEAKRARKVERLRERAEKKQAIADANSFGKVTGESNTGIPMGQPILIGHHSERRHRKHLERIDNKLRKGFEAGEQAVDLAQRASGLENRTAIDADNPHALDLLGSKLQDLIASQELSKKINKIIRTHWPDRDACLEGILELGVEDPTIYLKPNCFGDIGVAAFTLRNRNSEIARIKKRIEGQRRVDQGFEPFVVHTHSGDIGVELCEGQIQVEFVFGKPNEETRTRIKSAPISLKWSSYSKRWVRKHTETTCSQYFREELIKALEQAAK